jgi:anti-sigma factor (TIGR02949 family)
VSLSGAAPPLGLSCAEVLDRLSDFVDGELAPDERERVEQHLRACGGCERFGGSFRALLALLQRERDRPASLPEELRERLRRIPREEP